MLRLRAVIGSERESYVPSAMAAGRSAFAWLGLTDAALFERASAEIDGFRTTLPTADDELAIQAEVSG